MREFRKFWVVWCPTAGTPTHKHDTEESAEMESERLARQHRGQKFYVLEANSCVCTDDVRWSHATEDGEMPF